MVAKQVISGKVKYPFSTTAGSPAIRVRHPGHRVHVGDAVAFSNVILPSGNDSNTKSLLHLNESFLYTDIAKGAAQHLWLPSGTARLDHGALRLDGGVSDQITTPDHPDFSLGGGDFTVEMRFACEQTEGKLAQLYSHATGVAATSALYLGRLDSNVMQAVVLVGDTIYRVTGTTKFSTSLNRGEHHIAIVRVGGVLKLFIDGVQEGGDVAISGSVNDPTAQPIIGSTWLGTVREFRLSTVARWSANFTPPSTDYGAPPGIDPNGHWTVASVIDADNFSFIGPAATASSDYFGGTVSFSYEVIKVATPKPPTRDRHRRRSGADYAAQLAELLPTGPAWPRFPRVLIMRVLRALGQIWGSPLVSAESDIHGTAQIVDARAGDLLERESDPRKTIELLPDWERNFALPDSCFPPTQTIGDRQDMLVLKMTMLGGQSRKFFDDIAHWVGHTCRITEFAPFMAGISQVGDTRNPHDVWPYETQLQDNTPYRWYIGPPEMRFYWTAHAGQPMLTWFRASRGQAGVDPHLRIGISTDLECLLRRWKPAHTELVYDYSSLFTGGPMAGTP